MKKLTLLILFTSIFGHSQIDYKGLIRNLEDVTVETNLDTFFEGLPIEYRNDKIHYNDARFLRFYEVIINQIIIDTNSNGLRTMTISPFLKKADFEKITTKLIELYGEGELTDYDTSKHYTWITDKKEIYLKNELNNGHYAKLSSVTIIFN